MTAVEADPDELAEVRTQLYRRVDAYHSLGPTRDVDGWALWVLCARNAAWAGLVAQSWEQVAAYIPHGLLNLAAHNSVLHYDGERAGWRSLARDVAREHCGFPAEGSGDPCTLVVGHPGRHADPSHGKTDI